MKSMGMVDYPSQDAQIERTGMKWQGKLGASISPLFFMDFSWDTLSSDFYEEALEQGTITPTVYADIMRFKNNKNLTFQIMIKSKSIDRSDVKNWTYFLQTSDGSYYAPIQGSITSTGPHVTSSVATPDISWDNLLQTGPGFSSVGSISFEITRNDLMQRSISWMNLYFDWSVVGQQRVSEFIHTYNKNIEHLKNKNIMDGFEKQFEVISWNIDKMEIERIAKMKNMY